MKNYTPIISSIIGNILEWYDFGLFTIFSPLFSRLFFPQGDQSIALISTFGIFAVGFFCRPLGAILFGYLGDRWGRAKTLRLSILMITLPTLLIGFLPTYQEIGVIAPILLTIIRIWQGISIGGEYSGNIIYLAETAPKQHRAVMTALAGTGANMGILIASFVGILSHYFFDTSFLDTIGWRIAYVISGLICLIVYKVRLNIPETHVFDYLKQTHMLTKNPIKTVFVNDLPQLFRTIGLVCMGSSFYYFCFVYIPIYLKENLHYSDAIVSTLMSVFFICMIFLVPLSGWLCDKIGRKKMLLFNASFVIIIVIPGFYILLKSTLYTLFMILLLFTCASSLEQGTTSIAVVENFPSNARYTGLSLGYNIGNGFLGGTVPIICAWLTTHATNPAMPAVYIAFCAVVTWVVVVFFVPETKGKSLIR